MIPRTEVADVDRLYAQAAADSALIEIELDTTQLRAITTEEAGRILEEGAAAGNADTVAAAVDPEFADSLEALIRLSWPVWKGVS